MEKLIELLNEREKTVNGVQHPGRCKEHLEYQCHGPRVINKKFGFIKWLVDNDKIDRGKIEERISGDVSLYLDNREYYGRYKWLLMLLSIQDNSIEFLISILK